MNAADWIDDALCAQVDHELFFPDPGTSPADAKAICAACPVIAECREWAIAGPFLVGVFGGQTEAERRVERVARAKDAA